jgi:hypothetical protein
VRLSDPAQEKKTTSTHSIVQESNFVNTHTQKNNSWENLKRKEKEKMREVRSVRRDVRLRVSVRDVAI